MARDYERFPADENGDALWHMAEAGDDLGKPREVDFAVIFPTEATALQFAVHLLRNGQKVSFGPYEGDPDRPWQVYAHRPLLPTHQAITAFENDLAGDALAQKLGLRWVAVEDDVGCDPALVLEGTSILVFPLTSISKRVERGEQVVVSELFESACRTIERIRAEEAPKAGT